MRGRREGETGEEQLHPSNFDGRSLHLAGIFSLEPLPIQTVAGEGRLRSSPPLSNQTHDKTWWPHLGFGRCCSVTKRREKDGADEQGMCKRGAAAGVRAGGREAAALHNTWAALPPRVVRGPKLYRIRCRGSRSGEQGRGGALDLVEERVVPSCAASSTLPDNHGRDAHRPRSSVAIALMRMDAAIHHAPTTLSNSPAEEIGNEVGDASEGA